MSNGLAERGYLGFDLIVRRLDGRGLCDPIPTHRAALVDDKHRSDSRVVASHAGEVFHDDVVVTYRLAAVVAQDGKRQFVLGYELADRPARVHGYADDLGIGIVELGQRVSEGAHLVIANARKHRGKKATITFLPQKSERLTSSPAPFNSVNPGACWPTSTAIGYSLFVPNELFYSELSALCHQIRERAFYSG